MTRGQRHELTRNGVVAALLGLGFYFVPLVAILYIAAGFADVLRHKGRTPHLYWRYFLSHGRWNWLLAPFNLFVDLISYPNKGIWKLKDLPPEWRAEVETVLDTFRARKDEIIAEIDRSFQSGRRGMYVYTWYGKQNPHNIEEFNRDFRFVRTIAVSVFSGHESTSFHFGQLRMTLRVLYNLTPIKSDKIFIECQGEKHYWHDDPLFIFDDTLLHRSVNECDGRRYCVFLDIIRPTPFPGLLSGMVSVVQLLVGRINALFYKNWKMLRPTAKAEL